MNGSIDDLFSPFDWTFAAEDFERDICSLRSISKNVKRGVGQMVWNYHNSKSRFYLVSNENFHPHITLYLLTQKNCLTTLE